MNNMSLEEAYSALGIPMGASLEEIKKAYHVQVSKYHPDNAAYGADSSDEMFRKISFAYDIIVNNYSEVKASENVTYDEKTEDNQELKDYFYERFEKRREREEGYYSKQKYFDKEYYLRNMVGTQLPIMSVSEISAIDKCLDVFNVEYVRNTYLSMFGNYDANDTEVIITMFENHLKNSNLSEETVESLVYVMSKCDDYYESLNEESYKLSEMFVKTEKYDVDQIMGTAFIFPAKKEDVYYSMNVITPSSFEDDMIEQYKNGVFVYFLNILSLGKMQAMEKDGNVLVDYSSVLNKHKENFYLQSPNGTKEELADYLQDKFITKEK